MSRSFIPNPSVVHEQFGSESVVVNLDSGSYYSLDGSAGAIWRLVVAGASETQIVDRLGAALESATRAFLEQLIAEAMVAPGSAGSAGIADLPAEPPPDLGLPLLTKFTDMQELLQLDPIHEVDDIGWPAARRIP
jgi:hypothetical protein